MTFKEFLISKGVGTMLAPTWVDDLQKLFDEYITKYTQYFSPEEIAGIQALAYDEGIKSTQS